MGATDSYFTPRFRSDYENRIVDRGSFQELSPSNEPFVRGLETGSVCLQRRVEANFET